MIQKANESITDSIRYARTIQQAILPQATTFPAIAAHFVFYRPKDIVSGDFYWISSVEADGGQYTFAAVVDCTGHGVPGAFMSMIGYALLNELVNDMKEYSPATVLEMLDQRLRLALRQEEKANEDGMDVAFIRIQQLANGSEVSFAGAKRPLYIVQPSQAPQTLKGTSRSVGGLQLKARAFKEQTVLLEPGSMCFLYSDGFIDQSGGEGGKKYGSVRLKQLLEQVAPLPCPEQLQAVQEAFLEHKSTHIQKDDVTLIGLRL